MAETLSHRGTLEGHGDWVTSIATTPENPNMILSGSRDKVCCAILRLCFARTAFADAESVAALC